MSMIPVVISFYTANTPYQLEALNLIASCEEFKLPLVIEGIPSFGSWELNCAYKPFFIFEKLQQLKQPVLWVDADAVFVQRPEPIEAFKADLAVRINADFANTHPSKVMSGTLFANYTAESARLLRRWAHVCETELANPYRATEFWDQMGLRDVILYEPGNASIKSLPITYTKIFDQATTELPIIVHNQASRRFKALINKKI